MELSGRLISDSDNRVLMTPFIEYTHIYLYIYIDIYIYILTGNTSCYLAKFSLVKLKETNKPKTYSKFPTGKMKDFEI